MSALLTLFDSGPSPAFSANFMSGTLPPGLTYTNSSTQRVYWDATGTRRSAVANEPIFETLGGVFQGMRWEMEQRTNLATNSEGAVATWGSANVVDAVTPITGFSASLQFGDNSVARSAYKSISVTAGTTYTVSIFVEMNDGLAPVVGTSTSTGDFNLVTNAAIVTNAATVTKVSGSIYRVSASRVASLTATNNHGVRKDTAQSARTFSVIGIQVEAAASASSYIPTADSAVIRQPDVLSATSISPWYNQAEGTVVFEGIVNAIAAAGQGLYCFDDGTISERIITDIATAGNTFRVVDGGVNQALITSAGGSSGSVFRSATAYKANSFAACINAGTVATDASGTLPTVSNLRLGVVSSALTGQFMGYARRFDYYPKRLPDAQLQGMSRV